MRPPIKIPGMVWLAAYWFLTPLLLGVVALWEPLKAHQDLPNWVQAIGSIVAIFASASIAIWVSNSESRRADHNAWAESDRRAHVLLFVSKQLIEAITEVERRIAGSAEQMDPRNFDGIIAALETIPLIDVPAEGMAISLVNQRRTAFFYRQAFSSYLELVGRRDFDDEMPPEHGLEPPERDALEIAIAKRREEMMRLTGGALASHKELEQAASTIRRHLPA